MAPDFAWQDNHGKRHALKNYAGRGVILHFWASWCAPCRTEWPHLIKAAQQLPEIIFIAISSDHDPQAQERFLQQMGGNSLPDNLLIVSDPKRHITYDLFLTTAYPETILLHKNGTMRRKIAGVAAWDSPALQDDIKNLTVD